MCIKFSLIFLFSLFFQTFLKAQEQYSAFVKFKINNAGSTVNGFFKNVSAQITYNENEPSKTKFYGEVEVASINTGINLRDSHLKKKDYFDATTFPLIQFQSTVVSLENPKKLKVIGDLKMKGLSKKMVITVDVQTVNQKTKFNSTFTANRRDFKVGGSNWLLGDEVIVEIQAFN
jgi:polyisoprenoid-binding protein YceI